MMRKLAISVGLGAIAMTMLTFVSWKISVGVFLLFVAKEIADDLTFDP